MKNSNTIVFNIDPLPDFLADHTLTQDRPAERLREVVARWVQFVGALWRWRDQASFAIHFGRDRSRLEVALLAQVKCETLRVELASDLSILLKTHGFDRVTQCLPKSIKSLDIPNAVTFEVRQFFTTDLWALPESVENRQNGIPDTIKGVPNLLAARVLFPWWAPGGPFLLPMEKLVSLDTSGSITVFLEPTELRPIERDYLAFLAREAQSFGDMQKEAIQGGAGVRRADPVAQLVGRLTMANLRRLSDKPFLIKVHCRAANGRADVARAIAGVVEAMSYEAPFDRPQQDDERLPSAAQVLSVKGTSGPLENMAFTFDETDPLHRLHYLADARGAATIFRLPVNVRGGIPGIAVRQSPPDFHPGPREEGVGNDEIMLGRFHQGGLAKIPLSDLTKHALITGFTGSGKTRTLVHLLDQVHRKGVPVLIIESAKREYRGLLGLAQWREGVELPSGRKQLAAWVFTVGNELCAPIRLNPFELLPGVRLEVHLQNLQTCFEGALPPIGPLVSLIYEALFNIYERSGWRMGDCGPEVGERMPFAMPAMLDFYNEMDRLVDERGYQGEVLSNVRAAVLGRIKPLTMGSRGLIFQALSTPVGEPRRRCLTAELFTRSCLIELNDLNIDDKALLTLFLLSFLREWRELHPGKIHELSHLTVVEEAHNILENVRSEGGGQDAGADTRYRTVQAFSNMLSEVRALGEGLVIADQSPEKLAPDAMRNTNLQIAHQLRDSRDREAIARAMIMDDEQRDFLGKLAPGHAALFMTGLEKATFIRVPHFDEKGGFLPPNDSAIQKHMAQICDPYRVGPLGAACEECQSKCAYRHHMLVNPEIQKLGCRFREAIDNVKTGDDFKPSAKDLNNLALHLRDICLEAARMSEAPGDSDAAWCAYAHFYLSDDFRTTDWTAQRERFLDGITFKK